MNKGWRETLPLHPSAELNCCKSLEFVLEILDRILDGQYLLRVLVRNLAPKLFLKGHNQLDQIERVGLEVFTKASLQSHLLGFNTQLINDDAFDAIEC